MKHTSIIDALIENIKADQTLLKETEVKIETVKEEKRAILDRLKGYRKDASVLIKYADEKKKAELESLGFETLNIEQGMNTVASSVLDIILKATDNQMTNGALYDVYVKNVSDGKPVNYTQFNIKCRSLFNTQRLLRKKGADPKSSRDDIISLNGQPSKKDESLKSKENGTKK